MGYIGVITAHLLTLLVFQDPQIPCEMLFYPLYRPFASENMCGSKGHKHIKPKVFGRLVGQVRDVSFERIIQIIQLVKLALLARGIPQQKGSF